jgi:SAM-dependent methyltransferase
MSQDAIYPVFFARFYDIIYHGIRSSTDHNFYSDIVQKTKGPILEVGCGTGRLLLPALEIGCDIYGIDISPEMVSCLHGKLTHENKYRVTAEDIKLFSHTRKYDLMIAPFRVFMHLLTVEDQLSALNNIAAHLSEKGVFIFDTYVPNLNYIINGIHNVTDFEGEHKPGMKLQRISSSHSDLISQINNVQMKFIWDDTDGSHEEIWNTQLRFFFRYELEHLIARSDLKLTKILGNFDGTPLNSDSKEMIMFCDRK